VLVGGCRQPFLPLGDKNQDFLFPKSSVPRANSFAEEVGSFFSLPAGCPVFARPIDELRLLPLRQPAETSRNPPDRAHITYFVSGAEVQVPLAHRPGRREAVILFFKDTGKALRAEGVEDPTPTTCLSQVKGFPQLRSCSFFYVVRYLLFLAQGRIGPRLPPRTTAPTLPCDYKTSGNLFFSTSFQEAVSVSRYVAFFSPRSTTRVPPPLHQEPSAPSGFLSLVVLPAL